MIGETISHYRILDELGAGGMGVVYKAEDLKLKRTVALKFLPTHLLGTGKERLRFVHEAQAAAVLDHPNICTIHEIDTVDDRTFIAMAFISGESLETRVEKGPLKLDEAVAVALDLCDALGESHAKGVVHRDIKPGNIMISEKGRAVVLDFGLAKLKDRTKLTREGTAAGTAAYMSPEQTRGDDVDHRTDVWSLGVVLYQMITGQLPFRGEHESAIFYSVINEDPEPVTGLRSGVPMELERITLKALAKNPRERYQHIDDLRVDLNKIQECMTRAPSTSKAHRPRAARKRGWYLPAGALAVITFVIVIAVWFRPGQVPTEDERRAAPGSGLYETSLAQYQNSIAVLPLDNLSGEEQNEFFVDGMTEELITHLAQIKALKVISRTSIMRYKDTDKPLADIAAELNVATILEGSVLWADDRVRITAQLIDGTNDRHLWADSYESDLADVLGLQRSVAKEVARQVKVELTAQEEDRLAGSPVVNRDAYELYLKGRFWWNKRTPEAIHKAIDFYHQAAETDPGYALAYAGLGECYLVLGTWGRWTPASEIYPKAREHARRALEIDPNLAPAHAVLGGVANEYDWEWGESDSYYRRAIELNPNYATTHQWYAEMLAQTGKTTEAIEQIKIALELDPLSLVINVVTGWVHILAGDYDKAMAQYQKVTDLDPDFPPLLNNLTALYFATGELDKSAEAQLRFLELTVSGDTERAEVQQAKAVYERDGFEGFCRFGAQYFKRRYNESYAPPTLIAGYFSQIGEIDSAMVWLERGYEQRSALMYGIARFPIFRPLHSDPRCTDLLKKMNLEDAVPNN